MAQEILTVTVHEIAKDGLPPEDGLTGRVAFLHDGDIYHGWVSPPEAKKTDEAVEWIDAHFERHFVGVTHWLEFPVSFSKIEHPDND